MKLKAILLLLMIVAVFGGARAVTIGQAAQASPEVIDDGHYLAGDGSHIYYSTDGTEGIFCGNFKGEVYGRLPYGGGKSERQQLLTGCDVFPYPAEAMVTTGKETYVIAELNLTGTHVLFIRPADGSSPATQITADQNLAPRALAVDDEYVYYVVLSGTSSQIVRRHLVFGTIGVVAPVGDMVDMVNGLALDDTHVYWTEGYPGSSGRIRRAPKGGGIPDSIVIDLSFPVNIAVDGGLVYWAEEGGHRIGRHLKSGLGVTQTVYETDRPVTALHIYDGIVYFGTGTTGTVNGSLWRVNLDGQKPILMAYGFSPPRGILWAGGWVYWVDSKLRRLPPNAVSDPVDYGIEHIEVTQGVQDGDHTMPLVNGKPTMVRVYARELKGSDNALVTAALYGYRNGVPLPGSPLQPVANSKLNLDSDLPGRGDDQLTYLFQLPAAWIAEPEIELQAEINPAQHVFELDFTNNLYPQAPQKLNSMFRMVCLFTYRVAALTNEGDTAIFSNDPGVFDPRMSRAKALLPTLVYVEKTSTIVYDKDDEGNSIAHNIVGPNGEGKLLSAIAETASLSDITPGCEPEYTRHAGLVDIEAATPSGVGGRANGDKFWARWWESDTGLPYVLPAGGFLWAHELAHTLDRPHVDCGGAPGPGYYPYADPCTNGDSNDFDASWGFDLITGTALDPLTHRDLMAYGSQRWVSDYTWRCLSDYIGDQWGMAGMNTPDCDGPPADVGTGGPAAQMAPQNGAAADAADGVLVVHGLIQLGEGDLASEYSVSATTHITAAWPIAQFYPNSGLLTDSQTRDLAAAPNSGPLQLVILNSAGQPLTSKYIVPAGDTHEGEGALDAFFSVAIALPPGSARFEIRDTATGVLLFEKERGSAPPVISGPAVKINPAGDFEVTFSTHDPDGEPYTVIAQYIGPDGRKTLLANIGRSGTAYRCDPCTWPGRSIAGGRGAVRLLVSDGFETAVVDLPIEVPTQAPELSLQATQFGPLDADGLATYRLEAVVWDAEDRLAIAPPAAGSGRSAAETTKPAFFHPSIRTSWRINNEQAHFAENEPIIFLSKEILGLSPNDPHIVEVTLSAVDSDGQVSQQTIEIDLKPVVDGQIHQMFLPVIQGGE